MIDAEALLDDLKLEVTKLEDDIREHVEEREEIRARLRAEHAAARDAARTAAGFESWRDDRVTQAAVAWTLACVFVRYMEDNGLVDDPLLSGPGTRLRIASDHHAVFFQLHPEHSDREYLEEVFERAAVLPGVGGLFDRRHNPIWTVPVSADGAAELIEFWRRRDDATGELRHDFTDTSFDTRFLGDLYQNLSEAARKNYALLQTPEFVESFILDHTLDPAVDEFGLDDVRLIDPACGSGHFLLGAFDRLLGRWREREPATNPTVLAQRALGAIAGVDLNPFAVAIARFRLLVAALAATGTLRLADAPDFRFGLAAGDSLLHGARPGQLPGMEAQRGRRFEHAYATEDLDALDEILSAKYQVVVGNPPYITPKDRAVNQLVRDRYGSCSGKYSLGVPFTERFFDLASSGTDNGQSVSGYVGLITANSFMKRSFGKRLVEEYLPRWDVTHIIDTANVYLPGHNTPTVILFSRHRRPMLGEIRTVMGIRGDSAVPSDPAQGVVWRALVDQLDQPGSESAYLSVEDVPRERFAAHPWSIGGGGAAELKIDLDRSASRLVEDLAASGGITAVTGEDDLYMLEGRAAVKRSRVDHVIPVAVGEGVRDWCLDFTNPSLWTYDGDFRLLEFDLLPEGARRRLWRARSIISRRRRFGTPMVERGAAWYEWQELYVEKLRAGLSITFAAVSTHNHFVLDRGSKVFNRSAPVLKLPPSTSEDAHLELLGVLNSSIGCFWLKQVTFPKGGDNVGREGARVRKTLWDVFYDFDSTKLAQFPISAVTPLRRAQALDSLAQRVAATSPESVCASTEPTREAIDAARTANEDLRAEMIAEQEELDWECYRHYGLLEDPPLAAADCPPLRLGERAFEIILARQVVAGLEEPTWFERHGSTPLTEIPGHWPESYREAVHRRIELIEASREIGLIERPEYKRRWSVERWDKRLESALRRWLLDRLEAPDYWPRPELRTVAQLADTARADPAFMRVAALLRGTEDFDATALVTELVVSEAVSFLPTLRYKASGLRKRAQWESTWELQRLEDEIDARTELPEDHPDRLEPEAAERRKRAEVGVIPVPPKYTPADMRPGVWALRGKLDVPRERFTSFPGVGREADPTLLVGWAGWDHLERAKAVVSYMSDREQLEGWAGERLVPLLAGLRDLLPWLKQWHNDVDPEFGQRMGDVYEGHLREQLARHGLTDEDLAGWAPPEPRRGRRRGATVETPA